MSAYPDDMSCPECGGPMVARTNRTTGQKFWGCKQYPDCTGTRDTDGEARATPSTADELPSDRWRSRDQARRWR